MQVYAALCLHSLLPTRIFYSHTTSESICSQITETLCLLPPYLTACHIPRPFRISIPYSPLSCSIWELSIPCGWAMLREAHFLILELPQPQRFTELHRPTRATQRQPPSCLQEADSKAFVFGFYKRKFCGELPERSDEAHIHTNIHTHHSLPLHSFSDIET